MKRVLPGLVAAVLAVMPLSAQQRSELETLRAGMSATAYAQLNAELRGARERGLPTEPLVSKALEGTAKQIPGERIVLAVRQTAERLGSAQVLLRGSVPPTVTELTAVADAMQRGVPEDAIRKLTADPQGRASIALSAHAIADLLGHGVPLAVGVEVVGAWRGNGADPSRLKEIPAAVERLVRQGVVPAQAGSAVAAGLKLGRRPNSIGPGDVPGLTRRPK